MLTPSENSLRSSLAANIRWSRTEDRAAATAAARQGLLDKYEREVDPNNELAPAERARRAESLRKAHMQRMALKSAQSRRKAKEARAQADQLERDAAAAEAALQAGGGA